MTPAGLVDEVIEAGLVASTSTLALRPEVIPSSIVTSLSSGPYPGLYSLSEFDGGIWIEGIYMTGFLASPR